MWSAVSAYSLMLAAILLAACLDASSQTAFAQSTTSGASSANPPHVNAPSKEADERMMSFFKNSFSRDGFFDAQKSATNDNADAARKPEVEIDLEVVKKVEAQLAAEASAPKPAAERSAPSASDILPPDQEPEIPINAEAPSPFRAMARAYQDGDRVTASAYARQFVRYMVKLMFQVRELSNLIGEAMIAEGVIEEEEWVGVEQYLEVSMAEAREGTKSNVRATHEQALKQVVPDKGGEAEIYFFFSFSNVYSRNMAADVERLWQVVKADPKLRMAGLVLGGHSEEWEKAYRDYTGLTTEIWHGAEAERIAKALRVALVPTIVVLAPNSKSAFVRTGQQSFQHMYEFVRAAQGRPITLSQSERALLIKPVGAAEKQQKKLGKFVPAVVESAPGEKRKEPEVRGVSAKKGPAQSTNRF